MVAREKHRKFGTTLKNQVIFSILFVFEVEKVKKNAFSGHLRVPIFELSLLEVYDLFQK